MSTAEAPPSKSWARRSTESAGKAMYWRPSFYFPMSSTDRGLSGAQIIKRLGVSHVYLYQCHRYDADTPLEETMQALSEVVKAGKVRYIGFSEWPVDRVQAALAIPRVEKFVSSQPQYSLLHREPERALIPLSTRSGISQIVWSPLAQG